MRRKCSKYMHLCIKKNLVETVAKSWMYNTILEKLFEF